MNPHAGLLILALLACACPAGSAAAAEPAKPRRAAKVPPRKPAVVPLPEATAEQREAAERVFYGHYECEFHQSVVVARSAAHAAYVDVRHGKAVYVMKPILSPTGAVRLEDVKRRTLIVQIPTKSMLLDVQAGHRLVDECVSPAHRVEAARVAAAEAAASAASAAAAAASAAAAAASAASAAASAASAAGAAETGPPSPASAATR